MMTPVHDRDFLDEITRVIDAGHRASSARVTELCRRWRERTDDAAHAAAREDVGGTAQGVAVREWLATLSVAGARLLVDGKVTTEGREYIQSGLCEPVAMTTWIYMVHEVLSDPRGVALASLRTLCISRIAAKSPGMPEQLPAQLTLNEYGAWDDALKRIGQSPPDTRDGFVCAAACVRDERLALRVASNPLLSSRMRWDARVVRQCLISTRKAVREFGITGAAGLRLQGGIFGAESVAKPQKTMEPKSLVVRERTSRAPKP